ncbi:uncharacterized protein EV420DRAFT_1484238 [Desarmillaria tabescens]|uniref:Uncharacterized protein n=1 Tax=Armillaria tabescens TaxID=1929756 RepID=A0AA39MSM0_ARMTA|nr:uncharacterized protein EV420DRAFT_1484238 [Desarmillaria tabescens]KAK0445591.1 hypothetical protein EV420DRAFT_1484238 [Desarmillaria tabescens]
MFGHCFGPELGWRVRREGEESTGTQRSLEPKEKKWSPGEEILVAGMIMSGSSLCVTAPSKCVLQSILADMHWVLLSLSAIPSRAKASSGVRVASLSQLHDWLFLPTIHPLVDHHTARLLVLWVWEPLRYPSAVIGTETVALSHLEARAGQLTTTNRTYATTYGQFLKTGLVEFFSSWIQGSARNLQGANW